MVDAGFGTGRGHLHRCLALSKALHQRGARVVFLFSVSEEDVERIKRSSIHYDSMVNLERGEVQDYERAESVAGNYECWTIVVDSCAVKNGFVAKLLNGGFHLTRVSGGPGISIDHLVGG